jgi:hypothetical protein
MKAITLLAFLIACGTFMGMAVHSHTQKRMTTFPDNDDESRVISVAMIGNSMQYFNDFPRFLEMISQGRLIQNSCLHGGASIPSLLLDGNAMYPQFETRNSVIGYTASSESPRDSDKRPIYDYGACTVPQLLVGYDERIHDPGYALSIDEFNNTNPCRVDPTYLHYAISTFEHHSIHNRTDHDIFLDPADLQHDYTPSYPTSWDYVFINDNTMNPARGATRGHALATLERFYVPWLLQTGATPIFLWTHAYTPVIPRDMTGLEDIGNFTSLTRVGLQAYVDLLELYLPPEQAPKIAPVGLAFLAVYDDNRDIWEQLFHHDGLHASPAGTFLQGCIVHYTLFGKLPENEFVVRSTRDMPDLWRNARMMQHYWEPPNPFPTVSQAKYLYRMAERIMVEGFVPPSYIHYTNGEVADTKNSSSLPLMRIIH